ncbi:MAG: hypothetical protein IJ094_07005 [Bacilli bacterium]|nr:hypothetical protein [Bacilli bacterium]
MQKVLFYINNNLDKQINLSKIGLKIRKLNEDEYNDLLCGFKTIILTGKDLKLAKEYYLFKNKLKEFNGVEKQTLFDNISTSKNENTILNIYNGFNKNVFEVLTTKSIKHELNNFLIAEIDTKEFNKHFYKNYIYDLIPKIINFCNYMDSGNGDYEEFGQCKMYGYSEVKNRSEMIYTLFIMILTYNNTCSVDNKFLIKLEKMFAEKDREFNFSFIMMIDNILEDNVLVENRIINKVSFLERLLITKEEKKSEAFVLKVGILCNKLFDISNEDLSNRLKEIYNIRSMLVHGNGNKIIDKIDYYRRIFSNKIEKGKNKYLTKIQILLSVDVCLNLFLINVLNRYLDEPNLCEYMKQN